MIKEFQAPPRDENGSEKAKEILRTYIPDAFAPPEKSDGPVIRCLDVEVAIYTVK